MTIVRYSDAPTNPLVARSVQGDREGAVAHIDLDTGHVMDAKGNPLGRWSPMNDEKAQDKTALAAQYVAAQCFATSCYAMSTGMKINASGVGVSEDASERSAHMLLAAQRGEDISNPVHWLDLGTGDVHLPAALPNVAMGYRQEPPMADIYSPPVMVPKPSDYYFAFDKNDALQRGYPAAGAPAGTVSEVTPRLNNTLFTSTERALGGFVATQVEQAADVPLRILNATSKRVMNAMLLERELRVQSLARTSGNWNANNRTTLGAGFNWDGGASSDPMKDLHNRIEQSIMRPTGILMTRVAFDAMVRNPAFRAFYSFKDSVGPIPAANEISSKFGLPTIYVSDMKYLDSSGNISFVWGKDVVLFRQPDEMPPTTQDDIASSYTFRWNMQNKPGDATVAAGGWIVRQFYDQYRGSLGGVRVVLVHQDAEVQTSAFVGGLIIQALA